MSATLLSRLRAVRECGPGRWMAACPAHEDKQPSLSVRQLDDGRLLVHDFGGCDTGDVLAAVGLELSDLFPDRPNHHAPPAKRRDHGHAARDVLRVMAKDALLVGICAEQLARGVPLNARDRELLRAVVDRVNEARQVVG